MTKEEAREILGSEVPQKALEALFDAMHAEIGGHKREAREAREKMEQYRRQREEAAFEEEVAGAIRQARGRNIKAVRALLDISGIRQSERREEALREAIDALRAGEDSAFLFAEEAAGATARLDVGTRAGGGSTPPDAFEIAARRAAGLAE